MNLVPLTRITNKMSSMILMAFKLSVVMVKRLSKMMLYVLVPLAVVVANLRFTKKMFKTIVLDKSINTMICNLMVNLDSLTNMKTFSQH